MCRSDDQQSQGQSALGTDSRNSEDEDDNVSGSWLVDDEVEAHEAGKLVTDVEHNALYASLFCHYVSHSSGCSRHCANGLYCISGCSPVVSTIVE